MRDHHDVPRVLGLVRTCLATPSQWSGVTCDGRFIYIRYRWGRLTVHLDDINAVSAEPLFDRVLNGDGWDGYLTYEQLVEALADVLELPPEDSEVCRHPARRD